MQTALVARPGSPPNPFGSTEVPVHAHPTLPTAADLMQSRSTPVSPDARIEEAVRLLLSKGYAAAPVVDAEGAFSVSSRATAFACCARRSPRLAFRLVRDPRSRRCSTRSPPRTTSPSRTASAGPPRRLLVVENGRLVGLIARRDLMRALRRISGTTRTGGRSRPTSCWTSGIGSSTERVFRPMGGRHPIHLTAASGLSAPSNSISSIALPSGSRP
jgi:CBS domain-containing protein